MSDYKLSLTASEIDIALEKAYNPDTAPLATDNLVTSGGVKTYVDNAIGALDTTVGATVDIISVPPQVALREEFTKQVTQAEDNTITTSIGYVKNANYYPLPFTHGQITVTWNYNMGKGDINDPYAITLNIYDTYGLRITNNSNQITTTGTFPNSPALITGTFTGSFGNITSMGNGSLYIAAEGTYDNIQIIEGLPNTVL